MLPERYLPAAAAVATLRFMVPVLSTRAFGRLPTTADLALARRLRLFDFELWLDGFSEKDIRSLGPRMAALGLHVPGVHLPVRGPRGPLDVDAPDPLARRDALDALQRSLDLAEPFGPLAVILHARGVAGDGLGRLFEAADERGLRVALEHDTLPGSSLDRLLKLLDGLGSASRGHGVCVDLSRVQLAAEGYRALGGRLVWLEASSPVGAHAHGPPDGSNRALRLSVEACPLPQVAYEVVPVGPPLAPPGEAQLTMLLRQVVAWHLDVGQPMYEGASPFLPLG